MSVHLMDLSRRIRDRLDERRRKNVAVNWSPHASIFKLPFSLMTIDRSCTQPEMVSIGPYHRGRDHLLEFEEHKWIFLDKYLEQAVDKSLQDLLQEMEDLEEQTRSCYSESILMSKEDLIETMLLDGCFLVELFCYVGREEDDKDINDPIFSRPWLIPILVRDLVKLENQLPLSVLKSLSPKSLYTKPDCVESFIKHILEFFSLSWSGSKFTYRPEFLRCCHLLDLLYTCLLPWFAVNSIGERCRYRPSMHSMQCVTQLRLSGIRFKLRESQCYSDIKYEKQVLHIPSIIINDTLGTWLVNCVAWEQCQDRSIKYFSNYVSFMYSLIKQPNDVAILGLEGIITNSSKDDKYVSDLFHDLGNNTVIKITESHLWKVSQDVDAYYNSYWGYMNRTYFSSPWSFISVLSAFVLLMLTVVQTVMSILSYLHDLKN